MTARKRVRRRDSEATRGDLLQTATQIFADRGFYGARIDEIADAAGVNKRMIYVYFQDKEGIYREVLASHFRQVLEATQPDLGPEVGPRAQAEALVRRYFEFLAGHSDFVQLLLWEMLSREGRARSIILEMAGAGLEPLHAVIRRGVAAGVFRKGLDERRTVMSINALCLGYFTQQRLLEALWKKDLSGETARSAILNHTLELIFEGITTGEKR